MPRPLRRRFGPWQVLALLVLVTGTCGAVALLVSAWLVPPYLAVLALILFPTAGSPRRSTEKNEPTVMSGAPDPPQGQVEPLDDGGASPEVAGPGPAVAAPTGPVASSATTATVPAKPKRSRSRPRKVKPTTGPVEVVPATWVEVGPGKFVRVETPVTDALAAGPHLAVEPAPLPEPCPPGAEDSPDSPAADGQCHPTLAAEPALAVPSFALEPVVSFATPVVAPEVAPSPADVSLEPTVELVPTGLPVKSSAEEIPRIDPTIDGTTLQVEVDPEPDLAFDPIPEPMATKFAPDSTPDAWPCDAADLEATLREPTERNDDVSAANRELLEPVPALIDPTPGLEVCFQDAPGVEPVGRETPIARDLPGLPVVPLARVAWNRSPRRSTSRGSSRRAEPFRRRSTPLRRGQRRGDGRPRLITRTARPRSPPARVTGSVRIFP